MHQVQLFPKKSSPTTNRPQSSSSAFAFNDDAYWTQRLDSGRSNTVDSTSGLGSTASGDSGDGEFRRIVGVDTFIDNVLYNVVDNYAAILSCALIHSEIVESLCYLGTRGSYHLANKARVLLVEFLRTLSHILPDKTCTNFLNIPALVEFSTSIHAGGMTNRAHKSRQLLCSLADAFSVAPRHFRVSPEVVPEPMAISDQGKFKQGHSKGPFGSQEEGSNSGVGQVSGVSDKDKEPFYQFQVAGLGVLGTGAQGQLSLCETSEYLKLFHDPFMKFNLPALHQYSGKYMDSTKGLKGVARLGSKRYFLSSTNYRYHSLQELESDVISSRFRRRFKDCD